MDPIFIAIGLLGLLAFLIVINVSVGEASQGDLTTKTDLASVIVAVRDEEGEAVRAEGNGAVQIDLCEPSEFRRGKV